MTDLVIKAALDSEQVRLANELMAKGHHEDYFAALRWMETCGAGTPGALREHTRVALWRGKLAGALRVTTGTLRIGEARLRMGGLGWLTTSPRHRHRGIGRALMLDTLAYLQSQNTHVSMLFGIPNFYSRFGFATALAEYATLVDTAAAAHIEVHGHRVRAAKPGDIAALQKIHENNDTEVSCSLVRSAAHITNRWEQWKPARVVLNGQGRVQGYFVPGSCDGELRIDEAGAVDAAACGAVLRACGAVAVKEHWPCIAFAGPPGNAFARMAAALVAPHALRYLRGAGGMMSLVNPVETLETMIPEWESRLLESPARSYRTECTFIADGKPYRIRANRGAIDVAQAPGRNKVGLTHGALLHLLTGYEGLESILSECRRVIAPEGRVLLQTLFPERTPFVWQLDRF